MAMFKTSSNPKPAEFLIPQVAVNTTLEQDKMTMMTAWLAMWGNADTLRKGFVRKGVGGLRMRDKPSDDVSGWWGGLVEGGQVTTIDWPYQRLVGTVPAMIGALALTKVNLSFNSLFGFVTPTLPT